ncbi:PTS glucose transporter subunit IIBC [Periweissella cryptocerci]|uniref:PTS glucose transporter subunit IIBC n=1 Tax=Periweissella cryptocerci TaxID=2506420 RepID=A0A4P6YRE3_9LACO|nr:PTS transporter subunit EIIC [Periweissella cryptocerci]QBO35186.1 PTS glucose transporter subunit IIBC [Periweissella cryptocerci]
MPTTDYSSLATNIISDVGGKGNIDSLIHCITRLRFYLKDITKAQTESIKNLDGVIDVREAQGQYQVVIGNAVTDVYDAVIAQLGPDFGDDAATSAAIKDTADQPKLHGWALIRSGFDNFIGVITGSLSPIVGILAASGILKGLLAMFTGFHWLSDTSNLYLILNAIGDSAFYFLPILVGYSAAKKLGGDPIITAVIGGAIAYPTILTAAGKGAEIVTFAGINFPFVTYTYTIFPMILAAYMAKRLQAWVKTWMPSYLAMIFTPLVVILVVSAITLLVTGPVITWLADGLASGISWILTSSSWFGGLILGGLYQILVIFGLHWGVVPLVANDIATTGHSYLNAIICQTMVAQGAAVLAVAIKSRKTNLKALSWGAAISAFCGVTEPAIYGVNLRFKRVFISGLIGSAVGGFITGLLHVDMWGFTGSLIGFPSFINPKVGIDGSFYGFLIASAASLIVGFTIAYLWGYNDKMQEGTAVERAKKPGTK